MPLPERIEIPRDVLEIAQVLEGAGYEAWCVGGALRDTLLGERNTDYDIATSAKPEEVRKLFRHTVAVGERFGTVAVRTSRRHHEVTTFRKDVATDGRHAVVEFGVSLEEDLARRDFTINALAYHPLRAEWRDPFQGERDLEARLVRAVGEPETRYREDYLRILRGLRFAARFGFTIEPATWAAMRATIEGLRQLSAERVREEWFKGLRTARSLAEFLRLWRESGASAVWLPELREADAIGAPDQPGIPRDPVLLTVLFTRDPVSVLSRLKASRAEIARALAMVTGPEAPAGDDPVAVRRWLAAVGDAAEDLTQLWSLRHGMEAPWRRTMQGIRERGEATSRKQLAIAGTDLAAIGIPPGPRMGAILDRLLAEVVDDPSGNTREALLAKAERLK
jgi:tRNA nucleotidyltransferase (CCA-adding enzyme)